MHYFAQRKLIIGARSVAAIPRYSRREVAGDYGAQNGAKIRRTLGAEAVVKARLRPHPGLAPGLQPLFPGFGQMQFLGATVGPESVDLDQSVPLKRLNVATERGAIHRHFLGKALIVIGQPLLSFARIENWVTCSPTGARNWS